MYTVFVYLCFLVYSLVGFCLVRKPGNERIHKRATVDREMCRHKREEDERDSSEQRTRIQSGVTLVSY